MGGVALGLHSFDTLAKHSILMEPSPESLSGSLGRYSKESPYYIFTPKGVKCQICPNQCILTEGKESICRTKVARDEKLYTLGYGNPCSIHVDPIEKKPLFHFFPTSKSFSVAIAGCNLACLNCQNWEISQVSPRDTQNYDLFPEALVNEAAASGSLSIAYTYSEPIAFYEYMFDSAKLAHARGIKNVFISNGYINEKPLRDLAVYLDGANINLKSFSEEIYQKLNGGSLEPILRTLKILNEMGVWLEITNLIVPNWTDKPQMIKDMCTWLVDNGLENAPLHLSRFFPLYKLTNLPFTPLPVLEEAHGIARTAGIRYVYIGNVPSNDAENTYCPKCKKMIMERKGFTILVNNIQDGKCKFCGEGIAGRW
ncbi:MAG: AmmeMemoRadiSam system radical SAM enzyme [Bacteroidetes bacterium]|nr:MAG: AmmeMemoRadiSam system radical SAM enzyme [Bacteroidota bacterium]